MAVRRRREISKSEEIVVGESAGSMTKSDAWVRAIDGLHEKYFAAWKSAKTPEDREMIFAKLTVIGDVESEFRSMENNAEVLKREVH